MAALVFVCLTVFLLSPHRCKKAVLVPDGAHGQNKNITGKFCKTTTWIKTTGVESKKLTPYKSPTGHYQKNVVQIIGMRYTLYRPPLSSHTLAQTHRLSKPISLIKANHSGLTFDQTYANDNILQEVKRRKFGCKVLTWHIETFNFNCFSDKHYL